MASATAVTVAVPAASTAQRRPAGLVGSNAFFQPMRSTARATKPAPASARLRVRASVKENAMSGFAAAALTAALAVPDVAEAAQPGFSPSLNNFLLSIAAGGVVLSLLLGAVIAVANFDPVKRA